ncbi:unnamed protein product [Acanthoscelides obtectus]|uniref:Uncharacterized protein n=1 Tax=Acanthoscelides obtectus TaxID=200917 RepID=A0A9P0PRW0_ACAOB|nr:unnamed protein product [Acanthoscelides obtectus]CAK1625076.1 hypothetical protein AOBTE_LOCUS2935 [Acanthoscelides obtectus]
MSDERWRQESGWIRGKSFYSRKGPQRKRSWTYAIAHVIEVTRCGVCGKIIHERPATAVNGWEPQNVFVRFCPVCFQARPGIQEKRTDWVKY